MARDRAGVNAASAMPANGRAIAAASFDCEAGEQDDVQRPAVEPVAGKVGDEPRGGGIVAAVEPQFGAGGGSRPAARAELLEPRRPVACSPSRRSAPARHLSASWWRSMATASAALSAWWRPGRRGNGSVSSPWSSR